MLPLGDIQHAVLVGIDIQERLFAAMPEGPREILRRNAGVLLHAAQALGAPILLTQQYPAGLGSILPDLAAHAPRAPRIEKTSFSCCNVEPFMLALREHERAHVVLMGVEAHVCVLQTAAGLIERGFQVFVVEDAVCSRREDHRANALARMRSGGVVVTNTESLLFEWLRDSRHAEFKRLSALIK